MSATTAGLEKRAWLAHGGLKDATSDDIDIATCATRENSYSEGEDEGMQRASSQEHDYPFYDDDDEDEDGASFAARAPALPDAPGGPKPPTAPQPSLGSRLHDSGMCRPCAWYWKPGGCQNGQECRHCHECPEGEIVERRRIRKRMLERPPRQAIVASARAPAAAPWAPPGSFAAAALPAFPRPRVMATAQSVPAPGPLAAPPTARVRSLPGPGRLAAGELSPMMGPARSLPVPLRPPPGLELEPMTVDRTASAAPAAPMAVEKAASAPAGPAVCHPSVGSALHAAGTCKPCAWYWRPGGCQNGRECLHCHLCPPDEIKSRRKQRQCAGARGGIPRWPSSS